MKYQSSCLPSISFRSIFTGTALALLTCLSLLPLRAAEIPKVGDKAPDFTLQSLDDKTVRLSELTAKGNVVLVVLRGWPGYQCPICDRQVQDFIRLKSDFAEAKARIVFIYPGPADGLKAHGQEFKDWKNKQWPGEFHGTLAVQRSEEHTSELQSL